MADNSKIPEYWCGRCHTLPPGSNGPAYLVTVCKEKAMTVCKIISDKPYIVNLFVPTSIVWLSIGNNQGCVFLRVQLMIHLPWNFDTASENNISIISLPYSNQLGGILIVTRKRYVQNNANNIWIFSHSGVPSCIFDVKSLKIVTIDFFLMISF